MFNVIPPKWKSKSRYLRPHTPDEYKDAEKLNTPLASYAGKVILIVNTASKCGFTPQYEGLERLYQSVRGEHGEDFVMLGFPCNQFLGQEPGSDKEIQDFCNLKYKVSFPVLHKVDVNGPNTAPLFEWLKEQKPGIFGIKAVKWNFEKWLIGRDGQVRHRWASTTRPEALKRHVIEALEEGKEHVLEALGQGRRKKYEMFLPPYSPYAGALVLPSYTSRAGPYDGIERDPARWSKPEERGSLALADPTISAHCVPQWLWTQSQCRAWLAAFLIFCFTEDRTRAVWLARKFEGGGACLYSYPAEKWMALLGAFRGAAVSMRLCKMGDGAIPDRFRVDRCGIRSGG